MVLLSDLSAFDDPFDQGGDQQNPVGPGPLPGGGSTVPTPTPSTGLVPWFGGGSVTGGPKTGGGGGGGGYGIGNDFPDFGFGAVPRFNAPKFAFPSFEEAKNEPGYQLRLKAGSDALEHSAAAKGLTRTGGTLKDLATWNQDFAAGEYQNVANRSLQSFDRNYKGAYDEYAPQLAQWSLLSNAALQKALAQYGRGTVWNNPHAGGGGGGGVYDPEPVF